MTDQTKILLVEDDDQILRMLQSILVQNGYEVSIAKNGATALEALVREEFSVVLLDLGLPDIDGKRVIADSAAISNAPVLVVSARHSQQEKIEALDLGASDYIAKPFDAGELLARVRVALRPPRQCVAVAQSHEELQIDFDARRAKINDRFVRLSRKETEFLRVLADAEGKIVTHEQLKDAIWGAAGDADYISVRVLAWQVRRKIEPDAAAPRYVISETGEGYRLKLD